MPKVWNQRDPNRPSGAVYVGRPTAWGNPFPMAGEDDRDKVCDLFEEMAMADKDFQRNVKKALKGKDLVCWCAPKRCHADTLLRIANEE